MENPPLVSVLMTSYNRELYITEAIESVMASTYANWELIIVDDRSKDKTVEIVNSFPQQNIRLIERKDTGIYDAMNQALTEAKGEFIYFPVSLGSKGSSLK